MTSKISVEYKDNYIHAQQFGEDSYDASLELWQRIVAACEKHQCFNILGESFTTVGLSTMDAFSHIDIFTIVPVTRKHRVAWVHHIKETEETVKFAETALSNRGLLNGGLFKTVEEAKAWLFGESEKKRL